MKEKRLTSTCEKKEYFKDYIILKRYDGNTNKVYILN
jgi:hypothetical protein